MISADSYVFWTTVASVGLGAVLSGAGALWVHTESYRNTRKIARLAGGRFDNYTTETPDMINEALPGQSPITFKYQITDIIERAGYRAMMMISGQKEVQIDGEVDGHAFFFRSKDGWCFGVSKDKLVDEQKADVFSQDKLADDHPVTQAVTGPYAFQAGESRDIIVTYMEALKLVDDCIAKFRASV